MSETYTLPPRYYQYVATQSRVSDWVSQTHSSQHGDCKARSRSGTKSANDRHSPISRSASRRHAHTNRKTSRDGAYPPMLSKGPELDPLPPAIALISSSLVVCAFLPSLLAVSAFVVLLTWASLYNQVISCDLRFINMLMKIRRRRARSLNLKGSPEPKRKSFNRRVITACGGALRASMTRCPRCKERRSNSTRSLAGD